MEIASRETPFQNVQSFVTEFAEKIPVSKPAMPRAADVLPYLEQIDESGWYSNFGPLVRAFESRLAERFRSPTEVVTIANGTIALALVLQALGLPKGALCAEPSWTFVATAHAIRLAGLTPWFVDVEPMHGVLTPDVLLACLDEAPGPVVGVIPVAVMGQPIEAEAWRAFELQTGIKVVIDAAAGFDAVDQAPVPVMVSLHATKALGLGEGAFVATEDPELARNLRSITNFGFQVDRTSHQEATNAKLSEYGAAVGLAALDKWATTRLRYFMAAKLMRIAFSNLPDVKLQGGWGVDWISSTCIIRLPKGTLEVIEADLAARHIDTRRWWGSGCHRAPAFAGAPTTNLTVTEDLADSILGIPFFADIGRDQINSIVEALDVALKRFDQASPGAKQ